MYSIRLAKYEDLDKIMGVYAIARRYMEDNGNPTQWGDSYPALEMLKDDIEKKHLFVYIENNEIHGAFAFIIGSDESYVYIENGSWKNDDPYGTIHRIASDGKVKGIFSRCLDYCKELIHNLRIDTHENNSTMRHLIEKNGFEKCGIIYVKDGSPRIAYQYTRN
ncbi:MULTISPECIES: N-acetyltransferase [unclassified Sedimentibacter]|uniref:N-acetyltransferase n=1 Tax=unclassified Sedimentibacter TaxID=2649220 RepID=UPI0027E0195F|nr:N-acetyltransferase [Sedimentibacter sp. MB35-C1]WMJ76804.1 N-acetyltransferase [Sedimentibacter sp. MB35-C1]